MKNKIKKLMLATLLVTILQSGTARADSYALMGMGIGAGTGALAGLIPAVATYSNSNDCDDCNTVFLIVPVFAGLGALAGAGIGALIPRESKITFSPTIAPTKDGVNVGGNLAIRF